MVLLIQNDYVYLKNIIIISELALEWNVTDCSFWVFCEYYTCTVLHMHIALPELSSCLEALLFDFIFVWYFLNKGVKRICIQVEICRPETLFESLVCVNCPKLFEQAAIATLDSIKSDILHCK